MFFFKSGRRVLLGTSRPKRPLLSLAARTRLKLRANYKVAKSVVISVLFISPAGGAVDFAELYPALFGGPFGQVAEATFESVPAATVAP